MSLFDDWQPYQGTAIQEAAGLVIIGRGAIGRALYRECGGNIPWAGRGMPLPPGVDTALVTWPAQACETPDALYAAYPELVGKTIVTFCNGAWAYPGWLHGIAYVRATREDYKTPARWRVPGKDLLAARLRACGADVTASRPGGHRAYVWGKALYLLPLALACAATGLSAGAAAGGAAWREAYGRVLALAQMEIRKEALAPQVARMDYLNGRLPAGWRPSPGPEELAYFRAKLGYPG